MNITGTYIRLDKTYKTSVASVGFVVRFLVNVSNNALFTVTRTDEQLSKCEIVKHFFT